MLTSLRQGGAFANQVEFSEARSENGYGFWRPGLKMVFQALAPRT